MAKNQYKQLVDKRLSSARQLLSTLDESSNPIYTQGCLDSAMLQAYFALLNYVQELQALYQKPAIHVEHISLSDYVLTCCDGVPELVECKQLLASDDSWLSMLCAYPESMLTIDDESLPKQESAASSGVKLIALEESSSDSSVVFNQKIVQWVVDESYQLIQRQREHLIEC